MGLGIFFFFLSYKLNLLGFGEDLLSLTSSYFFRTNHTFYRPKILQNTHQPKIRSKLRSNALSKMGFSPNQHRRVERVLHQESRAPVLIPAVPIRDQEPSAKSTVSSLWRAPRILPPERPTYGQKGQAQGKPITSHLSLAIRTNWPIV